MPDEITEETIEEVIPDTPDETPEVPEGGEIEDIFNPDELEFDDNVSLEGYDLSKYKDIDVDSPEVQAKAKKFKELGFSQEQLELYLDETLTQPEETTRTPKEIREHLNSNLTNTGKKSYNKILNSMNGTASEGLREEVSKNPFIINIIADILGTAEPNKGVNPNQAITKIEKVETGLTVEGAMNSYKEWMQNTKDRTPEMRTEFLNNLIKDKKNIKELTKAFKGLLK